MTTTKGNLPAALLAIAAGAVVSISGGFVIASYAVSGITPAYASSADVTATTPGVGNSWRGAGYERVGLWQAGRANDTI